MRRAAHIARCLCAAVLMLGALGDSLRAQEGDAVSPPRNEVRPDASGAAPRGRIVGPSRDGHASSPNFERSFRQLSPGERRVVTRKLRRLSPGQRLEFLGDFESMPAHERRDQLDALRRRPRELPAALRTPEMRQRLREMSPQERREFFAQAREWREMSPHERGRMRARLDKFGALEEAEQRALIDEKFSARSPEQREKMLRELRSAAERARQRDAGAEASAPAPK